MKVIHKIQTLRDYAFPLSLSESKSSKRHVSLIVDKVGNVFSHGRNGVKTHPLSEKYGYRYGEMHSELDAFTRLPYYTRCRDDLILVNFRFNRFGEMRMSRPCVKCTPWCTAIFSRIFYSTRDGMKELNYAK